MKTLINLIILSIIFTSSIFSQSTKTLTRQLTIETTAVSIDFSNEISIKPNTGTPRLNLIIECNASNSVLESLVKAGRYDIKLEQVNGVTIITLPKMTTKIKLQDMLVVEKIKCEIFLPENIVFTRLKDAVN